MHLQPAAMPRARYTCVRFSNKHDRLLLSRSTLVNRKLNSSSEGHSQCCTAGYDHVLTGATRTAEAKKKEEILNGIQLQPTLSRLRWLCTSLCAVVIPRPLMEEVM